MIVKSYKESIGDVQMDFEHEGQEYTYKFSGGLGGSAMTLEIEGEVVFSTYDNSRRDEFGNIAEMARRESVRRKK